MRRRGSAVAAVERSKPRDRMMSSRGFMQHLGDAKSSSTLVEHRVLQTCRPKQNKGCRLRGVVVVMVVQGQES